MRLSEFLEPDFVVPRLAAAGVRGVIDEVAAQAEAAGVGPADVIGDKLFEREEAHPTVMGAGLAIPHATVPGLAGPVIGVALSGEPAHFGTSELDPVRVFFVLLSPPGFEREHVKLLARICRLVRHEGFIDRLEAAEDAQGIVGIIQEVDDQHV
jgi:mannitol/fructose-specific phosphotransferase system IIA component (Ntr-type)